MDLFVLGGTRFLGRHLVEEELGRGHRVTLFNRGEGNPGLFPQAEEMRDERGGDLSPLRGRRWDAAIDTSGYLPREVRASAELLTDSVGHNTFVSSISAYGVEISDGISREREEGLLRAWWGFSL